MKNLMQEEVFTKGFFAGASIGIIIATLLTCFLLLLTESYLVAVAPGFISSSLILFFL